MSAGLRRERTSRNMRLPGPQRHRGEMQGYEGSLLRRDRQVELRLGSGGELLSGVYLLGVLAQLLGVIGNPAADPLVVPSALQRQSHMRAQAPEGFVVGLE